MKNLRTVNLRKLYKKITIKKYFKTHILFLFNFSVKIIFKIIKYMIINKEIDNIIKKGLIFLKVTA